MVLMIIVDLFIEKDDFNWKGGGFKQTLTISTLLQKKKIYLSEMNVTDWMGVINETKIATTKWFG